MRYFLSILSLLIMFQPISWAVEIPMHAHDPVEHENAIPMMLISAIGNHCQSVDREKGSSDTLADISNQQESQLLANCIAVSSSAVSPMTVVVTPVELLHLFVSYPTVNISFHSRTESPEIRPPHSNHS